VIEVRTGSGLRVSAVDATAVSESMNLFLRGRGLGEYALIHEVRTTIEVQVAGLAAERATPEDIERLREVWQRMADAIDEPEAASVADVEFHRAVAVVAHNPLFVVMLDSIGDVMLEIRRATIGIPGRPAKGVKAHRKILAAIEAHDSAAAREAMREHLRDSERAWRRLQGDGGPPRAPSA
jgi:GntR family transcriptional repressor for pyruvate dehydrogenase complex